MFAVDFFLDITRSPQATRDCISAEQAPYRRCFHHVCISERYRNNCGANSCRSRRQVSHSCEGAGDSEYTCSTPAAGNGSRKPRTVVYMRSDSFVPMPIQTSFTRLLNAAASARTPL